MKERIDKILVDLGYFSSRERAKKNIMAGKIFVNNYVADKPGMLISTDDKIEVKEDSIPYVSRGGLKLRKAIVAWDIDLEHKICMDIGASTGGFTDVMLKEGAGKVYSVDVGYGQLDWKLRNDSRVINLERTNIRNLMPENIPDRMAFFSIDVSFISLKLILPKLKIFGEDYFECVALIKPQFEVGRKDVGKNGVVREPVLHQNAVTQCIAYAQNEGLYIKGVDFSPIRGPKGNIEYLMYLSNQSSDTKIDVRQIIADAHAYFKND